MRNPRWSYILWSVGLHIGVFFGAWFLMGLRFSATLVAAGPGTGGEGGGQAIEVGLVGGSELFRLSNRVPSSSLESASESNLDRTFYEQQQSEEEGEISFEKKSKPKPDVRYTDRPVSPQKDRIYSADRKTGSRSRGHSLVVGREAGTPIPQTLAGVGLGTGQGDGTGNGLPGGSEYGRRIQMIFSRNYTPPPDLGSGAVQYVVIELRITRSGRILSVSNGRLLASSILRPSNLALLNSAVERAVIASDPLPPFPAGLLPSSSEAVVELWFKYPK